VTALLVRPVAGRLSDTVGRLPLLAGGAALAAVGLAATGWATSLTALVVLRLVLGVAEALFFVASLAAVADLAPPSRLGEAVSYNSLGLYVGLTVGPPLGQVLVAVGGFRAAWLVASALCVAAAVTALGLLGETRDAASATTRARLVHVPALAPGVGLLVSILAMGAFLGFATVHAERSGLGSASIALVAYGATVVAGRLVVARHVDRYPPLRLASAALATTAVGLVVLATVPGPVGVLTGAVVIACGVVVSTPAFFSAIFATARPEQRGAAAGTASIALDLGLAGGPLLAGTVAQATGLATAFAVVAAVTASGALWTLLLSRRAVRRPDPAAAASTAG
jgi:predicted MFS family arabinose efflux permease